MEVLKGMVSHGDLCSISLRKLNLSVKKQGMGEGFGKCTALRRDGGEDGLSASGGVRLHVHMSRVREEDML